MVNEMIEDIPRFGSYQDKARVYGDHFKERLQAEHPERKLHVKISESGDGHEHSPDFAVYSVEEMLEVPKTGLGRLIFLIHAPLLSLTKLVPKTLARLSRSEYNFGSNCAATILDKSLRESAERILAELDEKSGETYAKQTTYSL